MTQDMGQKRAKKPNLLLRLVVFIITAALVLGALVLVVNRDEYNLNALKRWLTYRSLTSSQTGQGDPCP